MIPIRDLELFVGAGPRPQIPTLDLASVPQLEVHHGSGPAGESGKETGSRQEGSTPSRSELVLWHVSNVFCAGRFLHTKPASVARATKLKRAATTAAINNRNVGCIVRV